MTDTRELERELERLRVENAKLKADNESREAIHMLDQSEIVWLRRFIETLVEEKDGRSG